MLRTGILLGVFLVIANIAISQEVRPDVRNAVIILGVKNGTQEPIPYINVSFEDLKTGKTFLGKTNSKGKAHVKVPIGETYKIKVNDILVSPRYFVVNRPYSTMPKSVTYNGPVPKFTEEKGSEDIAKADTTETKQENLVPDQENVLIRVNMSNETGSPLPDEKVTFTGRKTKRTVISLTNSSGQAAMLLPKGDFYDLHLEKKRDFMVIHLPVDERVYGKTLNIKYKGTIEIEKEEQERQKQILQLKAKIAELEDRVGEEKSKYELHGYYSKLRRETIQDFEGFFNLRDVYKVYMPIDKAVAQGLVEYSIKGANNSTHYLKPAEIVLTNKTGQAVNVIVENGRKLRNKSGEYQSLICTKRQLFVLEANASETRELEAMCIEMPKKAPNDAAYYEIEQLAEEDLNTVTRFIERRGFQSIVGQRAVWVFTDKEPVKMIAGFKSDEANQLQELVRILTMDKKLKTELQKELEASKQQLDDIYRDVDDKKINFYNPNYSMKISGFFEYSLAKNSEVMIAMFNTKGIIVREIYYNPSESSGSRRFDFSFDGSVYPEEIYLFKLIIDSDVKKTIKLET